MPTFLRGLWREPDFVRLWSAHTILRFGSEVSLPAIPLTAALVLNASATQMGLLAAVAASQGSGASRLNGGSGNG